MESAHPNAKEAFRPGPLEYPPLEWIGWRPTRLRPIARAWKDSSLVFETQCLDTYELLNMSMSPGECRLADFFGDCSSAGRTRQR